MVVSQAGCVLSTGEPVYFVNNEVFNEILESKELARDVYNFFGKTVLIGRLGTEVSKGHFEEVDTNCELLNNEEGKVIDFYAKI